MVYHNIIITNIGVVLVKTFDFDRVIEKSPNIPFVLYFNDLSIEA